MIIAFFTSLNILFYRCLAHNILYMHYCLYLYRHPGPTTDGHGSILLIRFDEFESQHRTGQIDQTSMTYHSISSEIKVTHKKSPPSAGFNACYDQDSFIKG